MSKRNILCSIALIALLATLGCDDRGTNISAIDLGDLPSTSGVDPTAQNVYDTILQFQLNNPGELLLATAFQPAEAYAPFKPTPVLFLLAPEGGDKFHYFKAGLKELMQEMIATGEIDPMVVICIGNDPTFGGYFYGNSYPAGFYDSIFGEEMIAWANGRWPSIIDDPAKRGIGGIGQGAYGAFRAALKHPGLYSSISVADGPLDFDGPSGNGGLVRLFDDVMAEQAAVWATKSASDTGEYVFGRNFDTASIAPLSKYFTGGALAFSPNDTLLLNWARLTHGNELEMYIDSLHRYQITGSLPNGGSDSTAFIYGLIKSQDNDFDFHLPFDVEGNLYDSVWNRWMENNLDAIHAEAGGSPLAGVKMWIASNPNAKWYNYEMTQSWLSFLRSQPGYSVEEHPYSSFNGNSVDDDQYLYDLLREMLIFHSNNFRD